MGNKLWRCDLCNNTNLIESEYCTKCSSKQNLNNMINLNERPQNLPKLSLKQLSVDNINEVRLKINLKASQNARNLMNKNLNHFIDNEFPPLKQSLYMNGTKVKRSNLIHSNGFKQVKKWLRPHEISVSAEDEFLPISLFSDPSPKDVIQGELGTCWFLSALALLAEKPFLLLNCMVTQKYNSSGIHQVRLCRRGEWIVVNIDDYLPCDKYNQLVFSYGRRRQFWVPFMEKALAKLYGSYEAVARGACAEGLQTLTGEPCEVLYLQVAVNEYDSTDLHVPYSINENSPYSIWQKIITSRKLGYLMTTLCYNENLRYESFDKLGLLNRHIYSILDAREFNYNGNRMQILRLRNPWGHKEWKGDWSNGWSKWPEQIKKKLSVYSNNNGCFWIAFQDVLKYFYDITICKVRADWTESRQSSYFYDYSYGAEVYMITINQPGVHQFEIELFATGRKNKVFDRNDDPDIDLCLVLCKVNDPENNSGLTCIAFEHSVEYYITLSATLKPGNYMVFATSIKAISIQSNEKNMNKEAYNNHFTYNIIFHGQTSFVLNRAVLVTEIISDIFYSVALKQNKVKHELNGNVRTYIISGSCTHGILIENLSQTNTVKIQLDIGSSKNLESTRNNNLSQDFLHPGSRQLIAFLTPSNYRNGYIIGYKLDTQFCQYFSTGNLPPIPLQYTGLHSIRNVKS